MGFQQKVPPIPTRQAQIHMMQKLEQSWLDQSYLKYYMNEDLRVPKMQFAQRQNNVRRQFLTNFLIYGVALIPVTLLCRRFVLYMAPNTPRTYSLSNFINRNRTPFQTRQKDYQMLGIPVWLTLNLALSYWTTNFEPVQDQTYRHMSKVPKML